jgi:dTDP-4-dehydrorhamnose reductase
MKVLILGGTGMLGHKLVQTMKKRFETWCTIRGAFSDVAHVGIFEQERILEHSDVRDYETLESRIRAIRPDVVINAIGVIKQVPAYKDVKELITINSILPHKLAEIGSEQGFRLILVSTDCVFSGKRGNYIETDPADAEDVYGKSKHLGEIDSENCLTLRSSIIGRELTSSHSLTEWFLSQPKGPVRGFERAIYSGFPTIVFSEIMADIILNHKELSGIFHLSSDPISKHDLLVLMDKAFGTGHEILADDKYVIDRSLDSTRWREITGFRPLSWPEMVRLMASDPTPYDELRSHRQLTERSVRNGI